MSWPGWNLSAAVAAIVGFGLLGVYSYMDYSYVDTEAKSAPKPIIPVWVSGDEGLQSAQQPSDTPALIPSPSQSSSPGATKTPIDPWASEGMEAASREPFIEEPKELDEVVDGDDVLPGADSDNANSLEGSVPTDAESPSPENAAVYPQETAQLSTEDSAATSQQAPTVTPLTPPAGLPTDTGTSSLPPRDASLPTGAGDSAGGGSDKLKRILIIEDPRALSESLAPRLNGEPDLEVVGQTSSAAECRNFLAGEKKLGVSVVDLFLPDSQGIRLIEDLRKSCPHTPVLVLTVGLGPGDHERVVKAGADAVLSKGADPEKIISTVRSLASNQVLPTAPGTATNTEGGVGEHSPKNPNEVTTTPNPATG
jgi:DNA-binding NarL/FixJ family response regulator